MQMTEYTIRANSVIHCFIPKVLQIPCLMSFGCIPLK